MNKYLEMIENANTFIRLNEIVEEASFDDDLTNDEYEKICVTALDKARPSILASYLMAKPE